MEEEASFSNTWEEDIHVTQPPPVDQTPLTMLGWISEGKDKEDGLAKPQWQQPFLCYTSNISLIICIPFIIGHGPQKGLIRR